MSTVVFMGTPDFAAGILKRLLESDYVVTGVFTQPDRPKGRGKTVQMTPVKELALESGIPVYQPQKIRTPENTVLLRDLNPDFIVVAAFGQIIPQSILEIPRFGCLNVHASLLPAWRGAAPIQWSILNGDAETGVTIMRMNAGLDTGDIISKVTVPIGRDETGGSLFDRLCPAGADLLIETMGTVVEGTAAYTPQPEKSTTPYAAQLSKKDGDIHWTDSAKAIERRIRAMDPWPSAYTRENGKMLKIWKAEVAESGQAGSKESAAGLDPAAGATAGGAGQAGNTESAAGLDQAGSTEAAGLNQAGSGSACPGQIVGVTKDRLLVQTGDGVLSLLEVQPEGKKRMAIDAFLRGYQVEAGDVLGQ